MSESDWAQRRLIAWTEVLGRHRIQLTLALIALGVVFSWMARGIVWQPDVLQFFSANSEEVRNVRAAAGRPGLATQLRVDVHAGQGGGGGEDGFVGQAARELAEKLRASGEFYQVWTGPEMAELAAGYGRLVEQAPVLMTAEQRTEIERRVTPEFINRRFEGVRNHLADPDGEILLRQLGSDPLGLSDMVTGKLAAIAPGAGHEGDENKNSPTLADGLLQVRDVKGGRHVMLVLEPKSLPSDQQGAERTMAAVSRAVDAVKRDHKAAEMWVVGAHRGYVENARRIKRDVTWVSTVGAAAVALAIGIYFRRGKKIGWGAILICMIPPSVGVGIALGLAGMMRLELPLILLGFAGLLSGSTTDYGIQILAACRRIAVENGDSTDLTIPARAARRMLGPISMSVATSVTGFAALGLSESPGLRAMGLFVAGATVCIWAVTFLVLPAYVGVLGIFKLEETKHEDTKSTKDHEEHRRGTGRVCLGRVGFVCFVAATGIFLWAALHVRFDANPRALDGSSVAMLAEEQSFYEVWGDLRNRAIVQVGPADAAKVLDELARVRAYLADQERDGLIAGVMSPADILPDRATAEARAEAWRAFWTQERREQLRSLLRDAATANGMKPEVFAAYADRVGVGTGGGGVAAEGERMRESPAALFPGLIQWDPGVEKRASIKWDAVTVSSIVEMRGDRSMGLRTGWGPELRLRYPDVTILSGNLLIFDATERARAEGERLGPWCLVAILLPLWIYFRRLRRAWLVMTCLMVGFIWVLGAAHIFSNGLNLLSLMPVLFTLGVAVDYGIYRGSEGKIQNPKSEIRESLRDARGGPTFLCALTTVLGTGSLALAAHPALRWLGITMMAGIAGGYLTSLFIVGPLTRRWEIIRATPRRGWWPEIGRWSLRLGLGALTLLLILPVWADWRIAREVPKEMVHEIPVSTYGGPVLEPSPGNYVLGQSWMRWRDGGRQNGLWELMLAGPASGRGYATAKLAGPIDLRIENEMLDQLDYFLPQVWARWLVLRGMGINMVSLPQFVRAEDQEEIYWAARNHKDVHDYLAPTYPRILSYHALHDISQMLIDNPLIVPNTFACTGVVSLPEYSAADGSGHLMLARIFDFEGGDSFGRQKSITYVVPKEPGAIPFAHVAWPGLSGAVTGMNRERIGLFINAAATSDFRRIGTPTILMAREILEYAHNLDEAEQIIRRTQVFVSDIIVVADGKTGAARVFEKSPARAAAYAVKESAVVTNHLVTPEFAADPVNKGRKEQGTTTQRYACARQLLDGMAHQVTPEALAALLRDKKGIDGKSLGYGNRNAIDGLIACHAVVMDVTAGQMWVATWPYAEGKFIGVDVLKTFEQGPENFKVDAPAAPNLLGEDSMMASPAGDTASAWQQVQASRTAARAAETALAEGTTERALALADEVVRTNGDFYLGHELRGRALLKRGDFAGAKAALLEALKHDPPYLQRRAAIEGLIKQCDNH